MSVTVTLKYLRELGGDRWEYRRRVPESCKAAVGKTEWKRVFIARNAGEIARGHAKVDAEFMAEMKAALLGATPKPSSVSPRRAFEAALEKAEVLIAGAVGLDARALVAENIAATYPLHPEDGSPVGISRDDALTIKALINPAQIVPGYSLEDGREIHRQYTPCAFATPPPKMHDGQQEAPI